MIDAAQLPHYSRLKANPVRAFPPGLVKMATSKEFNTRREEIVRTFLLKGQQPSGEDLMIFRPLLEEGIPTLRSSTGEGAWVHLFTTPFRALDFTRTCLPEHRELASVGVNARDAVTMFQEFHSTGITHFALDDDPRTPGDAILDCARMVTPAKVLEVWTFVKSLELAHVELYTQAAEHLVQIGQPEAARELALDIVGQITMEAGWIHLLLGQLGVRLGDPILVHEARAFLRYFEEEEFERQLDECERAGVPDFPPRMH